MNNLLKLIINLVFLQVLTESEIDSYGKQRVQSILEEQKKTLRTLMSKPQVSSRLDLLIEHFRIEIIIFGETYCYVVLDPTDIIRNTFVIRGGKPSAGDASSGRSK